jgi:pimeloyl-ACP methyl ester carboxylesterase
VGGGQRSPVRIIGGSRHGSGPPVVLLHGIGHDRHAWDPLVELLASHRELVMVHLVPLEKSSRLVKRPGEVVVITAWELRYRRLNN